MPRAWENGTGRLLCYFKSFALSLSYRDFSSVLRLQDGMLSGTPLSEADMMLSRVRCSLSYRYIQNERFQEAHKVFMGIRDDPELIAQEMEEIQQAIAFEKQQTNSTWARYKLMWTDNSVRKRMRKSSWLLLIRINWLSQSSRLASILDNSFPETAPSQPTLPSFTRKYLLQTARSSSSTLWVGPLTFCSLWMPLGWRISWDEDLSSSLALLVWQSACLQLQLLSPRRRLSKMDPSLRA